MTSQRKREVAKVDHSVLAHWATFPSLAPSILFKKKTLPTSQPYDLPPFSPSKNTPISPIRIIPTGFGISIFACHPSWLCWCCLLSLLHSPTYFYWTPTRLLESHWTRLEVFTVAPWFLPEYHGINFGMKVCCFLHSGVSLFQQNLGILKLRLECSAEFTETKCNRIWLVGWWWCMLFVSHLLPNKHNALPFPPLYPLYYHIVYDHSYNHQCGDKGWQWVVVHPNGLFCKSVPPFYCWQGFQMPHLLAGLLSVIHCVSSPQCCPSFTIIMYHHASVAGWHIASLCEKRKGGWL